MTVSNYVSVSLIILFFRLLLRPAHCNPSQTDDLTTIHQFLQPHNAARAALGMPPLTWDPHLARYAQSWAGQRRNDCALEHSDGPHGENIFWGSGMGWNPGQAVAAWVSERKWYNYWSNTCAGGRMCGHYTQIVWRSTARLGCAVATCSGNGGTFMVCEYDPPGNYVGERPY
ncbi:hypothetical protein MLD38_015261 [Melastoma candidum]|uniref:Uncharacterized protein n=1 Tax=Melastoma candidum TaxID=119954 RepID=A0ACB9RGX2_9MYRT|nr:hypothetical protein MLD38_015261 [Melastoma candidum]